MSTQKQRQLLRNSARLKYSEQHYRLSDSTYKSPLTLVDYYRSTKQQHYYAYTGVDLKTTTASSGVYDERGPM